MKNGKEVILISFSGGETSGYLLYYMTHLWVDRFDYHFVVVFANTGEENEETLEFVDKCGKAFSIDIIWVEALVDPEKGKGTRCRIVDFETASRNGEPFRDVISKYGIPNQSFPHCNRELKLNPIHDLMKNVLGFKKYKTAIGIRYDEIDRMAANRKTYNIIYPLIELKRMTKEKINFWWSQQPFRLNLKGYQGNCKTCWKKSINNLKRIAKDNPEHFDFFKRMEMEFEFKTSEGRDILYDDNGSLKPQRFFRGAKSVEEIFELSTMFHKDVRDSSANVNYQLEMFDEIEESCDIFSMCGDSEDNMDGYEM